MFRSILAALVVALFAAPALADRECTPVAVWINPTEAGATNDFINLVDSTAGTTDAAEDAWVAPRRFEANNLRASVDVAPGAGVDDWKITLYVAGAATGLTCSIDETATACSDFDGATIPAGSDATVLVDSSGAAADPAAAAELLVSFCLEAR
jgi:hypothetical protein